MSVDETKTHRVWSQTCLLQLLTPLAVGHALCRVEDEGVGLLRLLNLKLILRNVVKSHELVVRGVPVVISLLAGSSVIGLVVLPDGPKLLILVCVTIVVGYSLEGHHNVRLIRVDVLVWVLENCNC